MEYIEIILLAEKLTQSNLDNLEGKRFLLEFYRFGIKDDFVNMANDIIKLLS